MRRYPTVHSLIFVSGVLVLLAACLMIRLGSFRSGRTVRKCDAAEPEDTARLLERLETAYAANSLPALELFLDDWHHRYRPNAEWMSRRNDTLRAAYDLFRDFFTPRCPKKDPVKSPGDTLYRYAIIQQKLRIYVIDDRQFRSKTESDLLSEYDIIDDTPCTCIEHFRPQITAPGVKPLYLDTAHADALLAFVGQDRNARRHRVQCKDGRTRDSLRAEYRNRRNFLQQAVPTDGEADYHTHATPPGLRFIVFNASFTRASICTDNWHSGDFLLLAKSEGRWEVVPTGNRWCWIE